MCNWLVAGCLGLGLAHERGRVRGGEGRESKGDGEGEFDIQNGQSSGIRQTATIHRHVFSGAPMRRKSVNR